jgi:hypothetical protein
MSNDNNNRARQRQEMRKQRRRQAMVKRPNSSRQIQSSDGFHLTEIRLPDWWRWVFTVPIAIGLVVGVIFISALINPLDDDPIPNAIWLDEQWTHQTRSDEELRQLSNQLREHGIGTIFVYTSSLRTNNTWSGNPEGNNTYREVEDNLISFMERWRQLSPDSTLYAWIELVANAGNGYRLDSPQVQGIVADFSRRMVENRGFDGILLDVKPIFNDNSDFLTLIREVRGEVGLDTTLAVAIPPDFTPTDAGIVIPVVIAPDTVFSEEYKQRIALQADLVVVNAYNSYLDNPIDYIAWVQYQVQAYSEAISQLDGGARLLIGIPHYADNPPAHRASIESIAGGLDGAGRGLNSLSDSQRGIVQGIALFADQTLTDNDWQLIREKWLAIQ